MEVRKRAAMISTGLNVGLTVLKFVTYFFTGSIAILAESWHSFTDVGTSLLVWLAVVKGPVLSGKLRNAGKDVSTEESDEEKGGGREETGSPKIVLEQKISLLIGLFLFVVSVMLVRKAIVADVVEIQYPLTAGLIFIVFAMGNYFVYRFETGVGKEEGSLGLVADGMHSRADMVTDLLTGFSLLLFKLGINLDRIVAGIIAIFIFSLAAETIVNVVLSITKGEKGFTGEYKVSYMLGLFVDPKFVAGARNFLEKKLGLKFMRTLNIRRLIQGLIWFVVFATALVWLRTVVYTVAPSEEAIVVRLGKPISTETSVSSGLHLKLPWPVDEVIKTNTKSIRELPVGNIGDRGTFALLWTIKHGTEEPFLTGDNNFFYPYLMIHYRIKNTFNFNFEHGDPENILELTTYQIIAKIFSSKEFFDIATTYRKELDAEIHKRLQNALDDLKTGIEILNIITKDLHPPIFIADSYEQVIAASQEKEGMINTAIGYKNSRIPEARAEAIRKKIDASAYVYDKTEKAEGEAQRFLYQLSAFKNYPGISYKRIYLDNMKDILKGNAKMIIDPDSGVPAIWLGFKSGASAITPYDF